MTTADLALSTTPPLDVSRRKVTTGSQSKGGVITYQKRLPLYSTVGMDGSTIAQELTFFGYRLGDPVPGNSANAGNGSGATVRSTRWHTNMSLPGQLPSPEMFTIYGIGLHMPPVNFAAVTTPGEGKPNQALNFSASATQAGLVLQDLLKILWSCSLRLNVGAKFYVDHPAWLLPGNLGFGGLGAVAEDNAGATAVQMFDLQMVSSYGQGYTLWPFDTNQGEAGPVLIAEGQTFGASLRCSWTTNPALGAHRALACILWGEIVRAAQ